MPVWAPYVADMRLIIFDLDGTLVQTKIGGRYRTEVDDWEYMPGRQDTCERLRAMGLLMAVATNQGSVAYGIHPYGALRTEIIKSAQGLGIEHVEMCVLHPDGTVPEFAERSYRRKPGPGMLFDAMASLGVAPKHTIMVGDRDEDRQAAAAAGTHFTWAWEFFGDPLRHV